MKYFLLLALSISVLATNAQKAVSVNSSDLVAECMKNAGELPAKQMAIWFPYNFWQLIWEKANINPDLIREISNEMSNYLMFAVVDYTVSGTNISFKSEEVIRKSILLIDSSKVMYRPLEEKDITPNAARLMGAIQPMMAQLLGQFGEGMRIFLFDAKKINGKPAIDIATPNRFSLRWDQTTLKWNMPFASILPAKHCPADGEEMKGNWTYCPFHGLKLEN